MGQNESSLPDNEYGLTILNNTVSFNVNNCPNPNQIKVQKGLLSFPSGKLQFSQSKLETIKSNWKGEMQQFI